MLEAIYDANSNLITVDGLTNDATGAYVNDASGTFELLDANGQQLSGATWPIAMAYVASSNGKYQGMAPATVNYTVGDAIVAHIALNAGGGLIGDWSIPCRVVVRES